MNKTKITLKRGDLCFSAGSVTALSSDSDSEETQEKLEMTIYSGGVIENHWFWGNLAIDVNGMSFPKKKFPILFRHDLDRKIAFGKSVDVSKNSLELSEATYVDTEDSREFRKLSKEGFPFEASFLAIPSKIEEIGEGEEAEVNGFTFKGPGTIWRKSQFKEASVCEFGYDPNTQSAAMSENVDIIGLRYHGKNEVKEETSTMNLAELKEKHPDLYKEIVDGVKSEMEAAFSKEKKTLETEISTLKGERDAFSQKAEDQDKRLASLEKENALRAEREIRSDADAIFSDQFSKTNIPERLFAKVRKMVSHETFVAEGKFDKEGFAKAVSEELKDWTVDEPTFMGFSTVVDKNDPDKVSGEKVDQAAGRLFGHLGMKQ